MSAKDGDGGVHAAMTSLIRFLLEKKHPEKVLKKKKEGPNLRDIFDPAHQGKYSQMLGSIDEHDFAPLEKSNIPEVRARLSNIMYLQNCLGNELFIYHRNIRVAIA